MVKEDTCACNFFVSMEILETKAELKSLNQKIGNPIGIHLKIQHRYQYGRYTVEIKFLDLPDDIPGTLAASRLASIQLHRESPWNAWIPPRVRLSITPSADPRPARARGSTVPHP